MAKQNVIVIGAGIIGASIAWHLVKAGARVTIIAPQTGGIATPHSFAWINASWGNAPTYARFRMQAMADWHRLLADIPNLPVSFNGSILWDLPPEKLEAFAAGQSALGYKLIRLDRTGILAREPGIANPPDFALHAPDEGALEPEEVTRLLIAKATELGAAHHAASIIGLVSKGATVTGIKTSDESMQADHVVIAAGSGSADLAQSIGVSLPLENPAGLLIRTRAQKPRINGLVLTPELHMRQDNQGRIIAGGDFGGSDPGDDANETARELFSKLKSMFIDSGDMSLESHGVGYRPMPIDGLPIIGQVKGVSGVSVAVMHSGVTLAPLVGRLLASEMITHQSASELEPYRLDRFSAPVP